MSAALHHVVTLIDRFDAAGIRFHVDGGWGVDALLDRETRRHGDFDLAVDTMNAPAVITILIAAGFTARGREGARDADDSDTATSAAYNPVYSREGVRVDVHIYEFVGDEAIASIGISYPREALTGTGWIGNRAVLCIAPAWVLRFHRGYELDADDIADVVAVAEYFALDLLPEQVEARARLEA